MQKNNTNLLYKSALRFLTPLSLSETYKIIVEEAKKLVGAKYASIFTMENGQLKRTATTDRSLMEIIPRKRGLTYQVYIEHKPVVRTNKELEKVHPQFKNKKVGTDLLISLSYHNFTFGVLSVISSDIHRFGKENIEVLKLFGPLATLGIRKALLFRELQEALNIRDLFISTAAHEIRTPLTSVYAYSQLIKKRVAQGKPPRIDYVNKLESEGKRLIHLVDELLQIQRIRTGKLAFEMKRSNLAEIIHKAIFDVKTVFPKHNFIFKKIPHPSVYVMADSDKLLQVFINILSNSAKYSSTDKNVDISINNNSSCYLTEIKDRGRGIAKEDLPLIFNKFYKGKDARKEGMGLGLYLVKNILDQHKAHIDIQSKKDRGTRVIIQIPKIS